MRLRTYRETEADWPAFVEFWSTVYKNEDEDPNRPDSRFLDRLHWPGGKLSTEDVDFLFEWKNGMKLSGNKKQAPARMKVKLRTFNGLRGAGYDELWPFAQECTEGPVWGRFICHIVSPERCPIWDQNVLRAFQCILGLKEDPEEIWEDRIYRAYVSFFQDARGQVPARLRLPSFRRLDQALFAFGSRYFPAPS